MDGKVLVVEVVVEEEEVVESVVVEVVVVVGVVVEIVVVGVVGDELEDVEIDVNGDVVLTKSDLRPESRPLDKSLNKMDDDLSQQACTSGTNVQARQLV